MSLINVNTNPCDMESRNVQARAAGEIIYRSLSVSGDQRVRTPVPWDNQACCGIMSPVRRTFCLLVTFDLIFVFTLWVIYTQVLPKHSPWDQFINEVVHYTFKSSLFDTVLCSAWRFLPLLLAYGMFRIRNPYVVAVTTFGTCVYVLSKVFLYKFDGDHDNVMCYLLLIVSFIISWVEVWFLDFKVLPQEEKIRQQEALGIYVSERTPLLAQNNVSIANECADQYYSPRESYTPTPHGSDDESTPTGFQSPNSFHGRSRTQSTSDTYQEIDYVKKAETAWNEAWKMLHTEDGWKRECGTSLENGIVYSRYFKHIGKLFKLETFVDASPEKLFEELVIHCDSQPQWNATVLEARSLQIINNCTDIYYSVAAEGAGGLVSSRDFVSLRHWKVKDGIILAAGCAVSYPGMPPTKKHVRGENRPGGWAFKPVADQPNRCLFCWIINTDLKGWIPQYAVDQALSGTLLDFTKYVKKHVQELSMSS